MPRTRFVARPEVGGAFAQVRSDLDVPAGFPPEVEEAAARAARSLVPGPPDHRHDWVTLDPAGSRDLDQAFCLERRSAGGWHLGYAIADVAAFVVPGGPVDVEAHARGLTLYLPDGKAPLHPPGLSEGRASLLPGQPTPALVWEIDVEADGTTTFAGLARRTLRSIAQLDYASAPSTPPSAPGHEQVQLLQEAGAAMLAAALDRGAVDLPEPSQEVLGEEGAWDLALTSPTHLERCNAQMSLAVGRAAGELQSTSGWGLLRTLPEASADDVEQVRRAAADLGLGWDAGAPWGPAISRLDPTDPASLAVVALATRLLRGAGYAVLVGGGAVSDPPAHAAVGAVYAHATAPLRRLGDRFVGECCLSAVAGTPPPAWVQAGLGGLDERMAAANRRAGEVERACLDQVEALLLDGREGEVFPAVAVDDRTVLLSWPPVRARCDGELVPGERVGVRLTEVDVAARRVRFAVARPAGPGPDAARMG